MEWLPLLIVIGIAALWEFVTSRKAKRMVEKEKSRLNELYEQRQRYLDNEISNAILQKVSRGVEKGFLSEAPVFKDFAVSRVETNARLSSALTERMRFVGLPQISSLITSDSGNKYNVSLTSCTCEFYRRHQLPCKHMYRLSLELGLLVGYDGREAERVILECQTAQAEIEAFKKQRRDLFKIISEKKQSYPWLATLFADYYFLKDEAAERSIRGKQGSKAAEERKSLRAQKKALQFSNKLLEYQLAVYESLFPWLEAFKELSPEEAAAAARLEVDSSGANNEYESLRNWLSKGEYISLPDVERYQLALDRWKTRKRSDWEAGIEYERFIGYEYEAQGYHVVYTGATQGFSDMGRDLIVSHENSVLVVQCKRYSKEKQIHENTVFQLYGSSIMYRVDTGTMFNVTPVIYTTASLSETAKSCADYLSIKTFEQYPLKDHPLIKCNISKSGERIYHLPFDQQYDRVSISPSKGEFFAATVAEAEAAGFRRAWRWSGNK